MTPDRLDAIRKRLDAAAEAPWYWEDEADRDFIAHAPEDIAFLLGEVERLQRLIHPWYGPCDAMGKDGACAECEATLDGTSWGGSITYTKVLWDKLSKRLAAAEAVLSKMAYHDEQVEMYKALKAWSQLSRQGSDEGEGEGK